MGNDSRASCPSVPLPPPELAELLADRVGDRALEADAGAASCRSTTPGAAARRSCASRGLRSRARRPPGPARAARRPARAPRPRPGSSRPPRRARASSRTAGPGTRARAASAPPCPPRCRAPPGPSPRRGPRRSRSGGASCPRAGRRRSRAACRACVNRCTTGRAPAPPAKPRAANVSATSMRRGAVAVRARPAGPGASAAMRVASSAAWLPSKSTSAARPCGKRSRPALEREHRQDDGQQGGHERRAIDPRLYHGGATYNSEG